MTIKVALIESEYGSSSITRRAEKEISDNEDAERVEAISEAEVVAISTYAGIEAYVRDDYVHIREEPSLAQDAVDSAIQQARSIQKK